jgi:sec-independent protein translocase protein TatB
MEQAADDAGVKEATDSFRDMSKGLSNPAKYGLDKVKDATAFTKWEPGSNTALLAEARADAAKKIHAAAADRAAKRQEAEAAAEAAKAAADDAGPADIQASAETPASEKTTDTPNKSPEAKA